MQYHSKYIHFVAISENYILLALKCVVAQLCATNGTEMPACQASLCRGPQRSSNIPGLAKTPTHIHSCCNRSLLPISTKLLHTLTYIAVMTFVAGQVGINFFREVIDIFVKKIRDLKNNMDKTCFHTIFTQKMHQTKSKSQIVTLSWSFCALVDVFCLKTEVAGGKHKLQGMVVLL